MTRLLVGLILFLLGLVLLVVASGSINGGFMLGLVLVGPGAYIAGTAIDDMRGDQ